MPFGAPEPVHGVRGVEAHETGAGLEREVQPGDVAEAGDDLGVGADHLVVEEIEDAHAPVAAGSREDGRDFRIAERGHEFRSTEFIGAGEVAIPAVEVCGHLHPVAQLLQPRSGQLHPLSVEGARRCGEGDGVTGLERAGQDALGHGFLARPTPGDQQTREHRDRDDA